MENVFQHQAFPEVCRCYLSGITSSTFFPISDMHLFLFTYVFLSPVNFSSWVVWRGLSFLSFVSLLTLEWSCLLSAFLVIIKRLLNMRCYGLPKVHVLNSWFKKPTLPLGDGRALWAGLQSVCECGAHPSLSRMLRPPPSDFSDFPNAMKRNACSNTSCLS